MTLHGGAVAGNYYLHLRRRHRTPAGQHSGGLFFCRHCLVATLTGTSCSSSISSAAPSLPVYHILYTLLTASQKDSAALP